MLYVAEGPLQVRVELPELPRVTLVGTSEQVGPDGETDSDRLTVPVNPLRELTVIVSVPVAPEFTMKLDGFAENAKSCTVNVRVVEWDRAPLVPVTVIE